MRALRLAANGSAPTSIPILYALDQLDRRYGQPPGSAATWDGVTLLRVLAFVHLENTVR